MNADACSEVLDILKYIPKEDYDKIPADYINKLYQNAAEDNKFAYNVAIPFDQQNISPEAKAILTDIKEKFWA